jgi:hypothetical protein
MSFYAAIDSYYMSAESPDVQSVRRLQTMPDFILKRDICYRFTCFTMNPFHAYISIGSEWAYTKISSWYL